MQSTSSDNMKNLFLVVLFDEFQRDVAHVEKE